MPESQRVEAKQIVSIPTSSSKHLRWFAHLGSLLLPTNCNVTLELIHPYAFAGRGTERKTLTTFEAESRATHYSLDELFSKGLPEFILKPNPLDDQGYYVERLYAHAREPLLTLKRDLGLTLKNPQADAESLMCYQATLAPHLYQDSRLQKLFTKGKL